MRKNNMTMIAIAIIILGLLYYFMQESGCTHCKKGSEVVTSLDTDDVTAETSSQEDEYFQGEEDEYFNEFEESEGEALDR